MSVNPILGVGSQPQAYCSLQKVICNLFKSNHKYLVSVPRSQRFVSMPVQTKSLPVGILLYYLYGLYMSIICKQRSEFFSEEVCESFKVYRKKATCYLPPTAQWWYDSIARLYL